MVHEQGTANVNVTNASVPVSGSVGLSSAANTVKIDPAAVVKTSASGSRGQGTRDRAGGL